MFRYLFLLSFCFSSTLLFGQVDIRKDKVYTTVDRMPCLISCTENKRYQQCCDEAVKSFMLEHLVYPKEAERAGLEGLVMIRFIVEKDGRVTEPEIVSDIGGGCGEEALRVVQLMPKWFPGIQANRPVPVRFEMPVRFSMDEIRRSTGEASPVEAAIIVGGFIYLMKKMIEKDEKKDDKKEQ